MKLEDLYTALFFHIHELGMTPTISQYIAAVQRGESTAAIWEALSDAERLTIETAYIRLRLDVAA